MPPAKRTSPRDHTGRKREELQAQHAEEIESRAKEMGMATARSAETSDEVTDLSTKKASGPSSLGPLGATKHPGQGTAVVDNAGFMTDSGQPGWPGAKTNDTGTGALSTPAAPTVTTSTTGGTMASGVATSYKVTATNSTGETAASSAGGVSTAGGGSTNSTTVTWVKVPGATGYKVYGRTSGSWGLMATITDPLATSWVDTGAATAGAAPPGANTSGTLTTGSEGPFTVLGGTIADQKVRPTVDVLNASRVGVPGGPDTEAPRVWLMGNPMMPMDPENEIEVATQPVHSLSGPVTTMEKTGTRVIRLNTTLEHVTIGIGTDYNFVEGQQYRVDDHIADYLEELGYVWH